MFLEISQNLKENICAREPFLINFFNKLYYATLLKKDSLAQVFSYKFCEISKNTFFWEHLGTIASTVKNVFSRWNFFIENIRDVVFHLIKFQT